MASSLHVYVGPFIEFDNPMIAAFESARGCDNCNVRSRSDAAFCDQCGRAITTYDLAVEKRTVDTFDAAELIDEQLFVHSIEGSDIWMPNVTWTDEKSRLDDGGVIYTDNEVWKIEERFESFFQSSIEKLRQHYGITSGCVRYGVVSRWA